MHRSAVALIALLLVTGQARAEDITLSCKGDVRMWWERDKGGKMQSARLTNYLVKIDTDSRTVEYGGKTHSVDVMDEGFMRAVGDDGPQRAVINVNRLSGELLHRIFVDGALMQSADLMCERARPKF